MFRATLCSSSGESNVSLKQLLYVTLCRWLSGVQVGKEDTNLRKYVFLLYCISVKYRSRTPQMLACNVPFAVLLCMIEYCHTIYSASVYVWILSYHLQCFCTCLNIITNLLCSCTCLNIVIPFEVLLYVFVCTICSAPVRVWILSYHLQCFCICLNIVISFEVLLYVFEYYCTICSAPIRV
jgi:hypothetical protein